MRRSRGELRRFRLLTGLRDFLSVDVFEAGLLEDCA